LKIEVFLKKHGTKFNDYCTSGGGCLLDEKMIMPETLLQNAEQLLSTENNAAKAQTLICEAIELQTNQLIKLLGMSKSKSLERKLQAVNELGILAPRILLKIQSFQKSSDKGDNSKFVEQVENHLDIAILYIKLLTRLLFNFYQELQISSEGYGMVSYGPLGSSINGFKISFTGGKKTYIEVYGIINYKPVMNYKVDYSNSEYFPFLRAFVNLSLLEVHPLDVYQTLNNEILEGNKS
jgi:hypothetical protein